MIVAGIDPSLTGTGLAILDNGRPIFRNWYGEDGDKHDTTIIRNRRVRRVFGCVKKLLAAHMDTIDLLVIEGPSYGSRYGNPHERGGLWHALVAEFDQKDIPIGVVSPKTRAMWATGRGDAEKPEVFAEVKTWWPRLIIANDDVGDALVLASMGTLWLGGTLPFEPKGRHRNALDNAEWPETA